MRAVILSLVFLLACGGKKTSRDSDTPVAHKPHITAMTGDDDTCDPTVPRVCMGQDVVECAAAPAQQVLEDAHDTACPAATREQVWRDGDVSGRGYPARDRLVVRPVTERVVDHHHPRPRPLAFGNGQQRIDRTVRGGDRDRRHAINVAAT